MVKLKLYLALIAKYQHQYYKNQTTKYSHNEIYNEGINKIAYKSHKMIRILTTELVI